MTRFGRRDFLAMSAAAGCAVFMPTQRTQAAPSFSDVHQQGPFVCRATFPLAEYEDLLAELPGLEREIVRVVGIRPPRRPIQINLVGDRLEYRKLLREQFPSVPYRRALFVRQGKETSVYAYRQPELAIDLRHECTHAVLHSALGLVPLWIDEGLAEYFEMPAEERAFGHPHLKSLRWNMRLGMVRTIESLEEKNDLADLSGYDYRFSWAWTHFMLHGPPEAHQTLVQFFADIARGAPPGLLSQRLAAAVPNPTERMIEHFKRWNPAIAARASAPVESNANVRVANQVKSTE